MHNYSIKFFSSLIAVTILIFEVVLIKLFFGEQILDKLYKFIGIQCILIGLFMVYYFRKKNKKK